MSFDFKTDYVLEDDIVRLRPLEKNDSELLMEYALNEPETWKFNFEGCAGAENLKQYIHTALLARQNEMAYPFIVYDKRTGQYAGSTRFTEFRLENKTVDIGHTWYGNRFRGTGLNKSCKYLLLSFGFEQMGMERVGFKANNSNERSKNAMKSIGCTEEGVMRNFSRDASGERIDVVVLSILRTEWYGSVKQMLDGKRVMPEPGKI